MKWYTLFSQTGSEISQLSERLNRVPDRIITNNPTSIFDNKLLNEKIFRIDKNDSKNINMLKNVLGDTKDKIVTLHGWLCIVPKDICERYYILNGHPGLINKYPELKGKDPQVRAFNGNYEYIGTVIHEVIEQVDEGACIISSASKTDNLLTLNDYDKKLRELMLNDWETILKVKLK